MSYPMSENILKELEELRQRIIILEEFVDIMSDHIHYTHNTSTTSSPRTQIRLLRNDEY